MKSTALAAILLTITFNASANDAAMEVCREKLKKANQLDVLYQFDWPKGRRPLVVAGPTYFKMPIDAKEGFAETVNCFLVGGKDSCIDFEIKHWQTGKAVARWSMCRLTPL